MKKTLKMLIVVLLAVCMVFMLCACGTEDMDNGTAAILNTGLEEAVTILARILEAAVMLAGTYALAKIGGNKKLQNTYSALVNLFDITRQTVEELKQTFVDDWKKGGNKLTPEQIEYLKKTLLSVVMKKLSEPVQKTLVAAGVDIQALITGEAESWVAKLKQVNVSANEAAKE